MIPIKNVYYMLSYAFRILQEDRYKNVESEQFDNIYDLYSSILITGTNLLIKRGLSKDYNVKEELTSSPHGKIDISASIKTNKINDKKVICLYDDFNENIYLNKTLKTCFIFLLKKDISLDRKKKIKQILLFFKDVDTVDIKHLNKKISYNRNNKHYQLLMSICYLLSKSLLLSNKDGSNDLMAFIDDQSMHRLYEKFILEFYKKECLDIIASSSKIDWQLDSDLDEYLPSMQSDIMLEKNNKILIIDAKYYNKSMQEQYDKKTYHSANMYQIFTYVKNKAYEDNTKEVSGMLLYAKTDEEVTPNSDYVMSGNKISVKTLDLNQEFNDIKDDLLKIADYLYN